MARFATELEFGIPPQNCRSTRGSLNRHSPRRNGHFELKSKGTPDPSLRSGSRTISEILPAAWRFTSLAVRAVVAASFCRRARLPAERHPESDSAPQAPRIVRVRVGPVWLAEPECHLFVRAIHPEFQKRRHRPDW